MVIEPKEKMSLLVRMLMAIASLDCGVEGVCED